MVTRHRRSYLQRYWCISVMTTRCCYNSFQNVNYCLNYFKSLSHPYSLPTQTLFQQPVLTLCMLTCKSDTDISLCCVYYCKSEPILKTKTVYCSKCKRLEFLFWSQLSPSSGNIWNPRNYQ